jgi:hypothetical protein
MEVFSSSAVSSLPNPQRPQRYTRADNIPETDENADGEQPTVRDYHAINSVPSQVRVPKKIATPVKVEGKVWFANERSTCIYAPVDLAKLNSFDSLDLVAEPFCVNCDIGLGIVQCISGRCGQVLCIWLRNHQYLCPCKFYVPPSLTDLNLLRCTRMSCTSTG